MTATKPFRLFDFSVPLAGIIFLVLGITYFACLLPVMACEEGTGDYYPAAEIIFRIITALAYPISQLPGQWFPLALIHLVAIVIDALVLAMVVHALKQLILTPRKR